MPTQSDLQSFYTLVGELEARSGRRCLRECHGRMTWPERGVYFFFEPGESGGGPSGQRIVRVGTHAITAGSRSTLWGRLSQHRGTTNPPGGNHRGSIFRLLVGEALMRRDPSLGVGSWGRGSTASHDVREVEREHEMRVSDHLGAMSLVVLDVPDMPDPDSARAVIERNSIALLAGSGDAASCGWLGHHSGRDKVRRSGLWNNRHVGDAYASSFLSLLEKLVLAVPDTREANPTRR